MPIKKPIDEIQKMAAAMSQHSDKLFKEGDEDMGKAAKAISAAIGKAKDVTAAKNLYNSFNQSLQKKYMRFQPHGGGTSSSSSHHSSSSSSIPPSMTMTLDRSSYGFSEIATLQSGGAATISPAIWLNFENFKTEPGNTLVSFSGFPAGVTAVYQSTLPMAGGYIQKWEVKFATSTVSPAPGIFPVAGDLPKTFILTAKYTPTTGTPLSQSAPIELNSGANPYFLNVNANGSNAACFSQDLGVFMLNNGKTKLPGTNTQFNLAAPDPNQYITDLITELNGNAGAANTALSAIIPPTTDFNLYPYTGSGTGNPNYAFAIARVRLNGNAPANNVRVFFRLFVASTSDTDYNSSYYAETFQQGNTVNPPPGNAQVCTSTTIASNGQQTTTNQPIPLLGTSGGDVITIPFFANIRVNLLPMTDQTDCMNVRNLAAPTGSGTTYAYFGCYLDYYHGVADGNIIWALIKAADAGHCCLVAEIYYPTAPPVTGTSCYDSNQLAQRNLVITASPNPGLDDSRRLPTTFDLKPSAQLLPNGFPDELMIDWGNIPSGSTANIYWPQVNADDVLTLANQFYPNPIALTKTDANTIQCSIDHNVTFIPIPAAAAGGQNFAGLITVNLPSGIKKGQLFTAIVYRLTSKSVNAAGAPGNNVPQVISEIGIKPYLSWKYVLGSFQINVPVGVKEVLITNEERALSILKWKIGQIATTDRWYKVIQRYIDQLSAKVNAMGGNAGSIQASRGGIIIYPTGGTGVTGGGTTTILGGNAAANAHIGKVSGLIYNHFGDFEGFGLEDLEGNERVFTSREREIEVIAEGAWKDRTLISVQVNDAGKIIRVILLTFAKPL